MYWESTCNLFARCVCYSQIKPACRRKLKISLHRCCSPVTCSSALLRRSILSAGCSVSALVRKKSPRPRNLSQFPQRRIGRSTSTSPRSPRVRPCPPWLPLHPGFHVLSEWKGFLRLSACGRILTRTSPTVPLALHRCTHLVAEQSTSYSIVIPAFEVKFPGCPSSRDCPRREARYQAIGCGSVTVKHPRDNRTHGAPELAHGTRGN
jgi:hypothetical protein